jgi:hypothetical protein
LNTQKLQLDASERMQLRDIQSKQALAQMKIDSDLTQTSAKLRADLSKTDTQVDSQESVAQLNAETKITAEAMKIAAKPQPQERPPIESFLED